jgi:ribosomal protein S18 acetylase RimI-like enzyme
MLGLMEGGVSVRDARADENGHVASVILEAYGEFADSVTPEFQEMFRADAANVEGRAPFTDLIVADRDGELVGTATLFRDGTGYGDGWPTGWAAIRLLAVAPEARGLGIGRALTAECIRRAESGGCSAIGLHTTMFMEAARRLYEGMGFLRMPELDFEYAPDFPVIGYLLRFE